MPGAGTRPAITRSEPPARLLDVTRLASRAGRGLTGVDRVERAYLQHLLACPGPLFGLARTVTGFALLDRDGMAALLDRVDGRQDWGAADLVARMARRLTPMRQRADADLRRLAAARSSRIGLKWLLRRRLPERTAYINVGHSNLTPRVIRGLRALPGATIAVMIHDTIPLDFPDFQRAGTVERFRALLALVGRHADLILANSQQTERDTRRWLTAMGLKARYQTALLGVDMPAPDPDALPDGLGIARPYFVCLGTIEPRKNHALLLDAWEEMARTMPPDALPLLVVAGSRGWRNEAVFDRLDRMANDPKSGIREVAGLSDRAVAALLSGAAGLLQPSFAEGYGLPCAEAAALQIPVICSDLPVYREMLGDIPVYLSPSDSYSWIKNIKQLTQAHGNTTRGRSLATDLPTWTSHFKVVLRVT